nr:PREDICTED: cysteine-rich receptor-like protein kinase 29 [Daucus carota subsp. sativus]
MSRTVYMNHITSQMRICHATIISHFLKFQTGTRYLLMTRYKTYVLFILCTFLQLFVPSIAQETGTTNISCNYKYNQEYTNDSEFRKNIEKIPSVLNSTGASENTFFNFSIGNETETVNVIALCRGDLILDTTRCQSCLSAAYEELVDKCTKEKESIIWKDECMLRYSDRNIFNIMTTEPSDTDNNDGNATAKNFGKNLRCLLDKLQAAAAAGTSEMKIATGNISVPQGTTFGLVQCTPDFSAQECKDCLGEAFGKLPDCCINKIGGRVVMPSCNVRYETGSAPFYFRTAAQIRGTGECGDGNTNITTIVIVVISTSLVALICMGLYIYYSRKKNQGSIDGWEEINEESLHYDFDAVKSATNNFSPVNELGKGGFGVVYKGRLADGREIAVKRLLQNATQGEREFKNEILLLAKLRHRNLVRLLGYSLRATERLLIYEFIANGSVDNFIYDKEKRSNLNAETRFKIVRGVARGLQYLHEDCPLRIVHRDLKPGNILLDTEMNPKIADFGLSRLFEADQTRAATDRPAGTLGYMAPEYVLHGQFSVKSDVFSFGVVVLEIITGLTKGFQNGETESIEYLSSYVWKNWRDGKALDVIDPILRDQGDSTRDMIRCIHVALLCVQENAVDRLTIDNANLRSRFAGVSEVIVIAVFAPSPVSTKLFAAVGILGVLTEPG